ncbi:MAG: hypothetical protein GWO24_21755, partial [Akkermansiaceae bacterium]|nr:hypothetical protein [Akkermansiaceae bacterium]
MSPLIQSLSKAPLAVLGFLAAGLALQANPEVKPLLPATKSAGGTLFTSLTPEQSGIDFVNPIDTGHPLKRIYLGAFACGG